MSTGIITTVAGSSTSGGYNGDNGPATSAELYYPEGVAIDSPGTIATLFYLFPMILFTILQAISISLRPAIIVSGR